MRTLARAADEHAWRRQTAQMLVVDRRRGDGERDERRRRARR